MGRATNWLKRLFGSKRESQERKKAHCNEEERKEKKRWSFNKSSRDSFDKAARIRSLLEETEQKQNKRAVAAVRLAGNGGEIVFRCENERVSAVKIQAFFRGYLARRALRALKALVKLQALVRGFLVRKKTAATLYSMEALIRAQRTVRAQKLKSLLIHKSLLQGRVAEIRTEKTASFRNSSLDWSPKSFINSSFPCQLQGKPLTPEWKLSVEECRCSFTAQSTPRFVNSIGNHPHYMSKTQAFEAKVRSQSAPKQRPEHTGSRKRAPLGELMAAQEQSRASLSRHGIRRSCSDGKENLCFKNAVAGRLSETDKSFFFQSCKK